jgi:predicted transcriptional regulator
MKEMPAPALSRRERQIMDVLYAAGRATAAEVAERMPDPPSYSTVRTLLKVLESKSHIRHEQDGPRYVYLPVVSRERAAKRALRNLVRTFFDGAPGEAVMALLDDGGAGLSRDELERISALITEARKKGR